MSVSSLSFNCMGERETVNPLRTVNEGELGNTSRES